MIADLQIYGHAQNRLLCKECLQGLSAVHMAEPVNNDFKDWISKLIVDCLFN